MDVNGHRDLYLINANGSGQHEMTTTDPFSGSTIPVGGFYPRWSPDGTTIAFDGYGPPASDFTPPTTLALIHPDGTGFKLLITQSVAVVCAGGASGTSIGPIAWSPNGAALACIDSTGDLEVVDANGGRLTEIVPRNGPSFLQVSWRKPLPATAFRVFSAAKAKAGTLVQPDVVAVDAFGDPTDGYRGTVSLTSSDPNAVLPSPFTYTASADGAHRFSVTYKTTGSQTVTASDGTISGTSPPTSVT
jgi:hypothetical protein